MKFLFKWFGPKKETFTVQGEDFYGKTVDLTIEIPPNDRPGFYEFEYIQDCGGGAMVCGPVIFAQSLQDAIQNGQQYVRDRGFACHFAFGNLPERVRRLPEEFQSLDIKAAEAAWKNHPDYNSEDMSERINPWEQGPLVTGRQQLTSIVEKLKKWF